MTTVQSVNQQRSLFARFTHGMDAKPRLVLVVLIAFGVLGLGGRMWSTYQEARQTTALRACLLVQNNAPLAGARAFDPAYLAFCQSIQPEEPVEFDEVRGEQGDPNRWLAVLDGMVASSRKK